MVKWVLFSQIEDVELILEQPLIAGGCSSVDDHLHVRDCHCSVGCPFRRYKIMLEVQSGPSRKFEVEEVGLVGDDELA